MLSIKLMGGLGNQLFQIYTLMACSMEYNRNYIIEKKDHFPATFVIRGSYWDNIFLKLKNNLTLNPINDFKLLREKSFEYNKIIPFNDNTMLSGYYQSYKYFDKYTNEIFNKLDLESHRVQVMEKFKNLIDKNLLDKKSIDFTNTVSIHFRFGDYVKLPDIHPVMNATYFINAMNQIIKINKDVEILYFCEESDIKLVLPIINKIQTNYKNIKITKVDSEMKDWEQLILMSLCKYNIIGNSSFSWWGAYLNSNPNKVVCYPDKWFGRKHLKNVSDLCPPEWIKCSSYDLYNVYYINLLERSDRKELVEQELEKLNWKYERFNAIKLKDGRVGCSMSHLKLLEMAKKNSLDYIVIVEDDIMFTNPEKYKELLNNFNNYMENSKENYDVLLLAGNLRPPFTKITNNILKISKSWTTTGYIVRKHYYDKLIDNIKEGITLLIKNSEQHNLYAIDAYWQKLQAQDNHYILIPRTVTQRPNYSTIENRYTDYNHLMLD